MVKDSNLQPCLPPPPSPRGVRASRAARCACVGQREGPAHAEEARAGARPLRRLRTHTGRAGSVVTRPLSVAGIERRALGETRIVGVGGISLHPGTRHRRQARNRSVPRAPREINRSIQTMLSVSVYTSSQLSYLTLTADRRRMPSRCKEVRRGRRPAAASCKISKSKN